MRPFDFDLFVIGGGSGGVRAARFAATLGAKVALCEERDLGGTCVNRGCVPKKLFSYAAHTRHDLDVAKSFGFASHGLSFDWPTLRDNKDREIERLNGIYDRLLDGAGVEVIRGRGVLEDANTIVVGDKTYTAKNILVAVGGRPRPPRGDGAEHIVTSDDIFHLKTFPKKILILGGGYIGVEFASIMHGLGAEVTLAIRGPKVLRGFDADVRDHLESEMRSKGIEVLIHHVVTKIEKQNDRLLAHVDHVEVENHHPHVIVGQIECDVVLAAMGRIPYTASLGLEAAGVDTDDHGAIKVDDDFRTSASNIYAVGDVIDRVQLTPVALVEGMYVAHKLFGDARAPVDYENIPTAVFTTPEIGTVGLAEHDAQKSVGPKGKLRIYESRFRHMSLTLSDETEKMFMKLIVNDADDRILGLHVVGKDAAEIVQGFAVAVVAGAKKSDFDRTIGIHPTAGEELVTLRTPSRVVDGCA